jgi:hypothetical protein
MAQRVEHHPLDAAFAALLNNGLDGAGEALRILVNEASRIERNHFLNAHPFVIGHDRVGGAIRFPKAIYLDQGRVVELSKKPCLIYKTSQACLKGFGVSLRFH